MRIGDDKLDQDFLGKENTDNFMENGAILKSRKSPPVEEIEIVNDILFELFNAQRNILHYSRSGTMQGTVYFQPDDRKKDN